MAFFSRMLGTTLLWLIYQEYAQNGGKGRPNGIGLAGSQKGAERCLRCFFHVKNGMQVGIPVTGASHGFRVAIGVRQCHVEISVE